MASVIDGVPWTSGVDDDTIALAAFNARRRTGAGGSSVNVTNATRTVFISDDYQASFGDVVLADTSGGPVTVTSPNRLTDKLLSLKKVDTSVNVLTFVPIAGQVDGGASYALTDAMQAVDVVCDGVNWSVF